MTRGRKLFVAVTIFCAALTPLICSAQTTTDTEVADDSTATQSSQGSTTQSKSSSFPTIGGLKLTAESRDRFIPVREDRTAINFGPKYVNVIFGGLRQGASFGLGLELTTADRIPGVKFSATGIVSLKLYRRFEFAADIPEVGSKRNHASFWFNYLRRTKENFFGIGPRTPRNRTNYDLESREFNGTFFRDITPNLRAGVFVSFNNSSIYPGQNDHFPDTQQLFSGDPNVVPITLFVPGLSGGARTFSYGAGAEYDKRDNSEGLTKGVFLYGRAGSFDGLDKENTFSDFGWTELVVEGRGYIPLTTSNKTSLALRSLAEWRAPKGGSQIFFHNLSYVGGGGQLRGYHDYRFRANNALLLSLELRQTVHTISEVRGIDVFGFGDAGQAWGDSRSRTDAAVIANNQFSSANWKAALGGGGQFRFSKDLAGRIEIARGRERTAFYFSISRGF